MKKPAILILFAIAYVLSACAAAPDTYTIEEISGIKHIHNTGYKWGDDARIDLEFVREYGELESEDDNYQFFRPNDLVIDSNGDVYILDSGNFRVQKFDRNGEFILSFGNKGQGPGEFQAPFDMDIDENDNLYIADYSNQVIHLFSSRGEYLRGIKAGQGIMPKQLIVLNSGRIAVDCYSMAQPSEAVEDKLVRIIDGSGMIVDEFGDKKEFEDEMLAFVGNDYFFKNDKENNIYLTSMVQNKIEKYNSDGDLLYRMSREKPYGESESSQPKSGTNPDGMTFYILQYNRFSQGIQADHKDRVWIGSMERAYTDAEWENNGNSDENLNIFEIYSSDGILLGILKNEFYTKGRSFRIFGDRVFILDGMVEHTVSEYRIIEK